MGVWIRAGAKRMTIAICYASPEGIVFGADSTSSLVTSGGFHYYNNNQKLFEVGENSTLGVLTWGLGGFGFEHSHRSLVAHLADSLKANPVATVADAANRLAQDFWAAYSTAPALQPLFARTKDLDAKRKHDPGAAADPKMRTAEEERQLSELKRQLVVGFCIGGYLETDRKPSAHYLWFEPLGKPPAPRPIAPQSYGYFGAPNMIKRLIDGRDDELRGAILDSGKWSGTSQELDTLLDKYKLGHPLLPIRDAVDFVHSCIRSTIKALKFSSFSQICGGPIELAVITTDRRFRWVRHKEWDAAIMEGEV